MEGEERKKYSPEDLVDLGENIRVYRDRLGYSQEQLAELSEVAPNTIHRIETGQNPTGVDKLFKIAGALGVPITLLCPEWLAMHQHGLDHQITTMMQLWNQLHPDHQKVVYATIIPLIKSLLENQIHL